VKADLIAEIGVKVRGERDYEDQCRVYPEGAPAEELRVVEVQIGRMFNFFHQDWGQGVEGEQDPLAHLDLVDAEVWLVKATGS